jgi:sporulation protein YlmC with PRC-barrel domain
MSEANERERHVELLIGRQVYDAEGRPVGRIEELHAEKEGDYYVVSEIDLGPNALLERLAVRHLGISFSGPHGRRARWDQIDLENDERPTLTVPLAELQEIGPPTGRQRRR